MRRWSENTLSIFTSASMEWVSRSVPPQALKEIRKLAMKEMGTPEVRTDTAQQSCLGQRNKECPILVCSCPENKIKMRLTKRALHLGYLRACHNFQKSRHLMWMRTNCWLSNKVNELKKKKKDSAWHSAQPKKRNLQINYQNLSLLEDNCLAI